MENKFDLTKQECEKILGHRIRNDTYLMIKKISLGESYTQVYDYIDKNRDELKIKKDTCLTSENTCQKYLNTLLRNKDKKNNKDEKLTNKRGIYGIYIDDKLIYIGKTNKSFKERFQQHKYNMNDTTNLTYLYRLLRSAKQLNKNIQLKPIIIVEDLIIKDNIKITERDIKMMELALITLYQPEANIEGRLTPYQ